MKVLFADIVHPILKEILENKGITCDHYEGSTKEEIQKVIHSYEGLVIRSKFPVDLDFLKHAEQLKFIARSGAGMENIDISYCEANNIQLFNAPEGNKDAVGEHAIAMLLMLFNQLNQGNSQISQGIWDREGNRGIELGGKTVGIIGYGNNGSAFAKKLSGFDVNVVAFDKYKSGFSDQYVQEISLKDLQNQSDIVSFHIPQNEETIFMGNRTFFNAFSKDIFVINLARGKIIQTNDLVELLQSGKIKGACLDVLEYEKASFENMFEKELPTDFQYLIDSKNVILSPHVGGWTHESYYKLSKVLADKICDYFHL